MKMNRNEWLDGHQKFQELAALAQRGTLSETERLELQHHLQSCRSCRQACAEYQVLAADGMHFLAAEYDHVQQSTDWDDRPTREKLMARVRRADAAGSAEVPNNLLVMDRASSATSAFARHAAAALVAAILVAVALGSYHLGSHASKLAFTPQPPAQAIAVERTPSDLIASQNTQISKLQTQVAASQQEISRLRDALRGAEARTTTLSAANSATDAQLRQALDQRDKLATQLHDAEQSYQLVQAELTTLRAEHDRVLLRTTSLQSKIDELTASAHDQEHRLKDDEQYLASDRDIRELMGARKLYIADVFDVDSGSRTRKPFGRVFYTESKSLIFYAFDLDRQPGVKNASAFQVWGQRDAEAAEKNHATNLGILYMDSESNRRWVLRLDDPKQLSEIDAVFVTVEPQGGSQKPTGKPFLYALLRKEANHP